MGPRRGARTKRSSQRLSRVDRLSTLPRAPPRLSARLPDSRHGWRRRRAPRRPRDGRQEDVQHPGQVRGRRRGTRGHTAPRALHARGLRGARGPGGGRRRAARRRTRRSRVLRVGARAAPQDLGDALALLPGDGAARRVRDAVRVAGAAVGVEPKSVRPRLRVGRHRVELPDVPEGQHVRGRAATRRPGRVRPTTIEATPRVPRGRSEGGSRRPLADVPWAGRGDAAGASRTFRGRAAATPRGHSMSGSRRRLEDVPRAGRGDASRLFRGGRTGSSEAAGASSATRASGSRTTRATRSSSIERRPAAAATAATPRPGSRKAAARSTGPRRPARRTTTTRSRRFLRYYGPLVPQ